MPTGRRGAETPLSMPFLDEMLEPEELALLRLADYGKPVRVRRSKMVGTAYALIGRGLLERDTSTAFLVVRCTSLGESARVRLTTVAVKRAVAEIARLSEDDPEAAVSLEYRLWRRVLVEGTLGFVPGAVQRAALLTTASTRLR